MEETSEDQASGAQILTFIPVKKPRRPTARPSYLQSRSSSIQLRCPPDYNNNDKQFSDLDLGLPQMALNYLPEGLLIEILLRLPVKSIFRFKCVSRHWLCLISDPSFYRSYVRHRHKLSFRIFYKYLYVPKFQDIFERLGLHEYASPPLLFLSCFQEQIHAEQLKILSVSNGLVLCGSLGPFIYYVCSPVTRQWVSLPLSNRSAIHFGEGLVSRVNSEDNVVTSYKVVRARWLDYESNFLNLETFSSERGEWTDHRLFCPQRFRLIRRGGGPISHKGVLHWFVYDHGLIAFDPYNNSNCCELIRLPEDRDVDNEFNHDGLYRLCDEFQGELRYFEVASGQSYCFSLWVLKNYEKPNQREWCLQFRVRRSDVWSADANIRDCLSRERLVPLAFHPLNEDVVYLRYGTGGLVISYHFQTKRLEVCCDNIGTAPDLSWRTVISFLLPMWPTPVPQFSRKAIKRF